ncbi:MAG: molybdenum cofactor biosynthesis protein MoaE [Deltaproteobacteria bacterium]|nr:molybdenum cofactor biosynthesis protein MoaE [Deltaproteobacteria bacterium]
MSLTQLIERVKQHPDYPKVGMILCHNGVVRSTSRDGQRVSGLRIVVDPEKLRQVVEVHKSRAGIVEILVHINGDMDLKVGEDVMYIVVAGDIRENVISTLQDTLNNIKATVTQKTQYFA